MTVVEWTGGDPGRMADFKKRDANHDGIVTEKESDRIWARLNGVANQIMLEAGQESRRPILSRARSEGLLRQPRRSHRAERLS